MVEVGNGIMLETLSIYHIRVCYIHKLKRQGDNENTPRSGGNKTDS